MNRRSNNELFPFNADGYAKVEDMLAEDDEYITLMKELFRKRFRTSSQYKNFVEDMTRAITHSLFLKKFAEGKRKVYERKYGELNYAKSQNDMELYTKISKLLYQTFDEFLETFKKVFVDMDFTYPRVLISAIKKKFYKSKIAKSKLVDNYSVFFFILCIFESSDRTDDADEV